MDDTHIRLAHGNGGLYMRELIETLFARHLANPLLDVQTDAAELPTMDGVLMITTDGFTVQPLEFPGGTIGSLAVHGTVNDLAVSGAVPHYLTLNAFIEEGFEISKLERIVISLAAAASEAKVVVVAGDTKVVPRGELALDQILNNAATLRHMSGGQFSIPLVIRMATGAGRQLAAQHSHSFEGWYAHIPGIKVLTPATIEDARGMLWTALMDPDPVIMFENALLYNLEGNLAADAGPVGIDRAIVRRSGDDLTLVTYGGSLHKTIQAAERLAEQSISAEVIDLRTLRPLDMETVLKSLAKTHRMVIIDEGWKSGSLSAEIMARVMEQAFYDLDAPIERVCSVEVPIPYARHLEQAAIPQVETILAAALRTVKNHV